MIREVETKEVIQPSQNDKGVGEQPHQKKLDEKEIEAKGRPNMTEPTILILYPQRLKKSKLDKEFTKFLEVFKKIHINILFADALEQMPSYVKFMKHILSNKRRLSDFEIVNLTEECSAILQQKLPQKMKDLILLYRAQLEIPSLRRPCVIWEQVLTSCRYLFSDD